MRSATQLQPIPAPAGTPATAHDQATARSCSLPGAAPRGVDRGVAAATGTLDRTATAIIDKAAAVGVGIEYLGVEPLHERAELYPGEPPWVICPADLDPLVRAGLPIPARQRARLARLVEGGLNFPHLYFAHEVPDGLPLPSTPVGDDGKVPLTDPDVERLVVRPDSPAATRKTAEWLDRSTSRIGRGLLATTQGTAVAVGGMAADLLDGLDPAVLGAITRPEDRRQPGPPAAYFLLVHWDW